MSKVSYLFCLILCAILAASPLSAFTPPGKGESFVYPDPASGGAAYLAFNMTENGQVHLLVYNESGSLVLDQRDSFYAGVQQETLPNYLLADGAYVYRLYLLYDSGDSEKLSGKFAVVR